MFLYRTVVRRPARVGNLDKRFGLRWGKKFRIGVDAIKQQNF